MNLSGNGTTDPGPVVFAPGGPIFQANSTDMVYDFGPEGSLASGVGTLVFAPLLSGAAAGNYSWTATP